MTTRGIAGTEKVGSGSTGQRQHHIHCRNCEALCGLEVTVADGRVVGLSADNEHPVSRGYACSKGLAMAEVVYDDDRVIHPLRRNTSGALEPVSWDTAIAEIAARTADIVGRHGPESVGWYMGNPAAFSVQHTTAVFAMVRALGTPHLYSPISQDGGSRMVASALLYGAEDKIPLPDIDSTRFLLILGANPLVSNGSMMVTPGIAARLHAIVGRDGRVVVVDPRRSETAETFEHLPIRPSSDSWLLLSLLHCIATGNLATRTRTKALAWLDGLEEMVRQPRFSPENTSAETGISAETVRALARDFAASDGAVAYGRTGICTSSYGTLTAILMDGLNALTGNLDHNGGALFGWMPGLFSTFARLSGTSLAGRAIPDPTGPPRVLGCLPAGAMHEAFAQHGGPVRAFFMSAGNPVLSVPGGDRLAAEIAALDLTVSIDIYVNESNDQADFILPATTWLELPDTTLAMMPLMLKPHIQASTPVIDPVGQARPEWEIIGPILQQIAPRLRGWPRARATLMTLAVLRGARRLEDIMVRSSEIGDRCGLRPSRLSVRSLRRMPGGVRLRSNPPAGVLATRRRPTAESQILPILTDEVAALVAGSRVTKSRPDIDPAAEQTVLLVGRRDRRSLNSWMHNVPRLMQRQAPMLEVSKPDALRFGLVSGDSVSVTSSAGTVRVGAVVTSKMMPGCVSLPHGWGHAAGWQVANRAGGVNANVLTERGSSSLERLAGMARLNGTPVVVARAESGSRS